MGNYIRNHYVPKWYQNLFFQGNEKERKFYYLDLSPDKISTHNGKIVARKNILKWGPSRCFCQDNLYTTKFGDFESTEIEQFFFGKIDREGKRAIKYFSDFQHPSVDYDAFQSMMVYLSSQKLRTPKGLQYVSAILGIKDKNTLLFKLQELHKMHCAIWTESVWCIVDASNSEIKFICTDHPVTVYNKACFPLSKWCRGGKEPDIWLNGTHTIFPLSYNKLLILTNLSWARNPYGNPLEKRPNAKLFRTAMFNFTSIQTGRFLNDKEVNSINYILKNRAFRYIAATKEEWLFPERIDNRIRWDDIGNSYLLMPDPRSMTFSSEIIIGYKDGGADAFDEYGRKPWHEDFKDKRQHEYEWHTFHAFQGEFARLFGPKRRGVAFEFGRMEPEEDNPEFHKYHLELEQKHKQYVKRSRKKRKKRKKKKRNV